MNKDLELLTPQLQENKAKAEEQFRVLVIEKSKADEKEKITSKEASLCAI